MSTNNISFKTMSAVLLQKMSANTVIFKTMSATNVSFKFRSINADMEILERNWEYCG